MACGGASAFLGSKIPNKFYGIPKNPGYYDEYWEPVPRIPFLQRYVDLLKKSPYIWKSGGVGNTIGAIVNELNDRVKKLYEDFIEWIGAMDPNDIIGPVGYGIKKFVSKADNLNYRIRFENQENATAPAQLIQIKLKLSENLDLKTFRLNGFGINEYTHNFSLIKSFSQMSFAYSRDDSLLIRFQAGVEIVTHEAFWIFEAIDKQTGDRPKDPSKGLLPPKNETLVVGEGFATFSIKANENAFHLAEIEAEAEIIFDENEPILTQKIINTIDDSEPMVDMIVDFNMMSNGQFGVKLNKFDNGSGVNSVSIFQNTNNNWF